MNAQLPQIVNENVLPNHCSFGGCAAFREFGYSWQLLCWNMTHTAHQAMSVTYIQDVYEFCRNGDFAPCFVLLLMPGVCEQCFGQYVPRCKEESTGLIEEQAIKVQIHDGRFFSVLCQVLSAWDKINDKCTCLFQGSAICMTHTQTVTEQNNTEYNQMQGIKSIFCYSKEK